MASDCCRGLRVSRKLLIDTFPQRCSRFANTLELRQSDHFGFTDSSLLCLWAGYVEVLVVLVVGQQAQGNSALQYLAI